MPNTKEEFFSDGATQGDFDTIVISLGGTWDPGLPIAASRAGALGLLDLTLPTDAERVVRAILRLQTLARGRRGLLLKGQPGPLESAALEVFGSAAAEPRPQRSVIVLTADDPPSLSEVVARCRPLASRLGMLVLSEAEAELAADHGLDFVLAKGNEAGGRVSAETTFVLLQRLLAWGRLPTYAWGGIGFSTAVACWAAGAAGIVLDWQLALLRESPLSERVRSIIAALDGSETQAVEAPGGGEFRSLRRPPAESSSETANWPVGQDAAFASLWREEAATVAQVLGVIGERIARFAALTGDAVPLRPGSPLAVSHGTRYPLVQGPMAHVSDTAAFARAVASGGALPFLALARMSGRETAELLETTREALGTMPWGVGLLGFAPRELWKEQLEALRVVRPAFALIAGGRPDQAEVLESWGIRCYLHAPSPETLSQFLGQGARRFVIEGRESGGHVGPRSSFTLWETSIHSLLSSGLDDRELAEVHVLFAGGIGDGLGGSMVSALAQPLVRRGVKVGALMGTAYLLTREIVETGAVVAEFQAAALACRTTRVLEAAPGHAVRCADGPYCRAFERERLRLVEAGVSLEECKEALERLHLGRLAVAAKGIARSGEGDGRVWGPVSATVQREEGLYLMGQGAGRATASLSIPALHEEVCVGAPGRCGNVDGRTLRNPLGRARPPAPPPLDIAIIGMSCLLPGARSLDEYWRNVVAGRDLVTEVPPDRFPVERWFDPDPEAPDRIYSRWGGFLPEIEFDPVRYGIPPAAVPSIDPAQLLSLQLVNEALADAGYRDRNPDRARTSVIFGAGGGLGEVGCGYVARALLPGLVGEAGPGVLDRLPAWTEDSFPGLLPNVIAGRISNRFDLGGANYTIDAACASSLAALQAACRELSDGSSDLAIAGAADTVQNPFSYLAFSKTKALSPRGRCRPFDRGADGIVISEGLAAVVLKRLSDAERD
ncbi:MAG: nitronate monooxygenase, partial [Deltaproteobacteria bacterium]|nr:nitronate monooxygenase [Deltaproteobacteria bacterium]